MRSQQKVNLPLTSSSSSMKKLDGIENEESNVLLLGEPEISKFESENQNAASPTPVSLQRKIFSKLREKFPWIVLIVALLSVSSAASALLLLEVNNYLSCIITDFARVHH